jgi:hypothetical protein
MDIEKLRAKAAWIYSLTGNRCPWQVETLQDLLNYIQTVLFRYGPLDLTGAQVRDLTELGESLTIPPEVLLARRLKQEQDSQEWGLEEFSRRLEEFSRRLEWRNNRGKALSRIGASARREMGEQTRHKIIRLWKRLASMPKRERARHIAASCQLTVRHVRRVVRTLRLE